MKRNGNVCIDSSSDVNKNSFFPGIYSSASMEELMFRVLDEDDYTAFQFLFHKMYRPLCSFCEKFVGIREVAEEVVSDVFYTIWKNRHRITVTSPKSYLYTAVRNRAFDYLRGFNRTVCCELEHAAHLPSDNHTLHDALEHAELELQLNQGIGSLPRQCKIIFELSRDEGLKYKEIAEELSISIKTVEAQIGKALKHLRKVRETAYQ
jgi:RNA polymerase sigma-70 factor, ECF subfamily